MSTNANFTKPNKGSVNLMGSKLKSVVANSDFLCFPNLDSCELYDVAEITTPCDSDDIKLFESFLDSQFEDSDTDKGVFVIKNKNYKNLKVDLSYVRNLDFLNISDVHTLDLYLPNTHSDQQRNDILAMCELGGGKNDQPFMGKIRDWEILKLTIDFKSKFDQGHWELVFKMLDYDVTKLCLNFYSGRNVNLIAEMQADYKHLLIEKICEMKSLAYIEINSGDENYRLNLLPRSESTIDKLKTLLEKVYVDQETVFTTEFLDNIEIF